MVGTWRAYAVGVLAVLTALLGFAALARAADFSDGNRFVFVSAQDSEQISVIDSRDDSVAGILAVGLVPSELEIAGDLGRLAAVDGRAAMVAVVSVRDGSRIAVPLDFVPQRLVMAADGRRVVAAAPAEGRLAVIDMASAQLVGQGQVAPFRDLLIMPDNAQVLVSSEAGEDLLLVSLSHWTVTGRVEPPRGGLGGFGALSRAPDNRRAYARALGAPVVVAVDLRNAKVIGEVPAGGGKPYTNAMGITLILPDDQAGKVTLVPASLRGGVTVSGEAGMNGVYNGWFDTVAFIPSTAGKKVLVVDQPGRFRGDDIVLGATPGRGTVTPDGRKFYLPLVDAKRVAVIDAERRSLARYVMLPHRPAIALMGRTFGLCH